MHIFICLGGFYHSQHEKTMELNRSKHLEAFIFFHPDALLSQVKVKVLLRIIPVFKGILCESVFSCYLRFLIIIGRSNRCFALVDSNWFEGVFRGFKFLD